MEYRIELKRYHCTMVVIGRVAIQSIERKRMLLQACRLSHLSVGLPIR